MLARVRTCGAPVIEWCYWLILAGLIRDTVVRRVDDGVYVSVPHCSSSYGFSLVLLVIVSSIHGRKEDSSLVPWSSYVGVGPIKVSFVLGVSSIVELPQMLLAHQLIKPL